MEIDAGRIGRSFGDSWCVKFCIYYTWLEAFFGQISSCFRTSLICDTTSPTKSILTADKTPSFLS